VTRARRPDNPWSAAGIGDRYAHGRPYRHPWALARGLSMLGQTSARRALDVACGTGMSSRALTDFADVVVGVDGSAEMLHVARVVEGAQFVRGEAELLPFADAVFDAITCCSAVHWFDQQRFFAEARRVLTVDGWVVLYDHYFIGEMVDAPDFTEWTRRAHDQFPLPPRNPTVGDPNAQTPDGFEKIGDEFYVDEIEMTQEQLVDYQLTQSNFVAPVEHGTPLPSIRAWLHDSTASFYAVASVRTLRFLGSVTCLRPTSAD
jgi:SAM-dependent methyltransferase